MTTTPSDEESQSYFDSDEKSDQTTIEQLLKAVRKHNGQHVQDYPSSRWALVPFPMGKGEPYNADNLATVNDHSFLNEPKFQAARENAESRWTGGYRDISWRLHVALWASSVALQNRVGCDFLELGSGRGYMAAGICSQLTQPESPAGQPRKFTLIDSYSHNPGDFFYYADNYEETRYFFSKYPFVKVVKGVLPEVLNGIELENVGFIHLDLNDADVESLSLELLGEYLKGPYIVLFDDSGNPGCGEQLLSHRSFAQAKNCGLLQLPTGQALCFVS